MSCQSYATPTYSNVQVRACVSSSTPVEHVYRDLVSAQTGALLILIGSILSGLLPGCKHIAPHTGEMLVKIGRKLTGI